jgi:hypothetical protein
VPRTAAATTALIQIAARTGQAPGTRITSTGMAKAKQKAQAVDAEEALQQAIKEFAIQPRDVPRTLIRRTD